MRNFQIFNQQGKARIKIIGPISAWKNNSDDFTRMVDELIDAGIQDADVYLNCYGGSVYEANEILNQLNRFKGTLTVTLGAIAASAGFTLITPFSPENTWCHRNTQGMYHEIAGMIQIAKLEDFDSSKKQYQDLRENVVELLAERMGMTTEEVSENIKKTTWLNSKELVKLGVVGKGNIIDKADKAPTGTKNALQNSGIDLPDFINQVEESDLDDPENQNSNHNETEMKELAKKLGLLENATADQIAGAIEALQNKAKFGEQALVNLGVSKGFKKETLEKSVTNNFDGTLELVNDHEGTPTNDGGDDEEEEEEEEEGEDKKTKKPKPSNARPSDLIQQLIQEIKGSSGSGTDKTWNDYSPEELETMEEKEPKKFNQLFDKEFGTKKSK